MGARSFLIASVRTTVQDMSAAEELTTSTVDSDTLNRQIVPLTFPKGDAHVV